MSPSKFYKSLAFHGFESGVYAFAYRFVRSATGQQTDWVRLTGIVEVP